MGSSRESIEAMQPRARQHKWGQASAPLDDWRSLIREAQHEEDVIQLVRDHMARWSPEELARLPEECRPARIRDADDISQWAYVLASCHCAGTGPEYDDSLVDRMLEFVTQAALRVSEIKSTSVFEERARMNAND